MKKILFIMLICLLFSVSSCKFRGNNHEHKFIEGKCECGETDPNYIAHTHNYVDGKCECGATDPNNSGHTHEFIEGKCECGATDPNYNNTEVEYTFISKEEIEKAFDVYYSKVNLNNTDGSSNTFVICENSNYFYYNFKSSEIILDKANNDIYLIDNELKVKTLDIQLTFDKDANKNVLIDLLSEHIEKVDGKYTKVENQQVGNYECDLYEKLITVDTKNYAKYQYYVDKVTGYCVKAHLETVISGTKSVSAWEFVELSFEESSANQVINPILEYETEIAPLEFNKWPDMGLALLIPEYPSGDFSFAIDYGDNALISIENTRLNHVKDYANSLQNYGFAEGKGATNEASQYVFITYNSDNIMVKIVFTSTVSNLSIQIIKSTPEEINKELNRL
ncbi:MAG: hypothetical protein IJB21_01750 [Bacilli bacterium]|nr:hypothetical protein [Bacilli bacterium]